MRLLAYYSNKGLDEELVTSFARGAREHGVAVKIWPKLEDVLPSDVVVLFGVKARVRHEEFRAAGIQTIVLDKGYVRHAAPGGQKWCEYWRVAVNAHHPTGYLMDQKQPHDRFNRLGLEMREWRRKGDTVIYAGSSDKYHRFNGLEEANSYARSVVSKIRKLTNRAIIYRPKPSWKDAQRIEGVTFSRPPERIHQTLVGAHVLVTNGSNACFEAVLAGVPTIVLGEAVAKPISSTSLKRIERPQLAGMDERLQWAANLAYAQWTMPEMRSGECWSHIGGLLRAQ